MGPIRKIAGAGHSTSGKHVRNSIKFYRIRSPFRRAGGSAGEVLRPSRGQMADIVHARDDLTASTPAQSKSRAAKQDAAFSESERTKQPPRTDVGTLTLHWLT